MTIKIIDSCEATSEAELNQFEQGLSIKLPLDYRMFLLLHNGGKPKPSLFRVDIDGFENQSSIQRFLCLNSEERYSLSRYLEIYKDRIPSNLLPIATELSVDLICLSVSGEDLRKSLFLGS